MERKEGLWGSLASRLPLAAFSCSQILEKGKGKSCPLPLPVELRLALSRAAGAFFPCSRFRLAAGRHFSNFAFLSFCLSGEAGRGVRKGRAGKGWLPGRSLSRQKEKAAKRRGVKAACAASAGSLDASQAALWRIGTAAREAKTASLAFMGWLFGRELEHRLKTVKNGFLRAVFILHDLWLGF